jgi:hypothetical protein
VLEFKNYDVFSEYIIILKSIYISIVLKTPYERPHTSESLAAAADPTHCLAAAVANSSSM